MRMMFGLVFLAVLVNFGGADDKKIEGKRHDYEPGTLPNKVKIKLGDSIVVTHKIKPADVEEMQGSTDNTDVTVRGRKGKDTIEIIIQADKKGKAKVGWEIFLKNGRLEGRKDITVEFE
jgi:hypothetical protein